jgi:hypothetical protein
MAAILELKKYKHPPMIINAELEKYEKEVIFSKKLEQANAYFDEHPLPGDLHIGAFSKKEQEHGFEVSGLLMRADVEHKTFLVIEMDGAYEIHYNIHTQADTLNNIVRAFWGEPIKVLIRPQISAGNVFEYELIEVKVD